MKIGAAVQSGQLFPASGEQTLLETHFNSLTAEYEMKAATIAPTPGTYNFAPAETLLGFAEANAMDVRGHALLWHQTTPGYFFEGSQAEIRTRLETYITDVVTRFRGRVTVWDVVNEVADEAYAPNPVAPYRNSNWYQATSSPDFIEWAFRAARAADPNVKLFLNDYETRRPEKRAYVLQIVQDLLDKGVPIDGIGHQGHLNVQTNVNDLLAAIDAVDALGANLEQHVTEIDVSIYDDPGTCWESGTNCQANYGAITPDSVLRTQAQKYRDLMAGLSARSSVTSATLWGVTDGQSWLNTLPITRTNAPLLFDRSGEPKAAFHAITNPDFVI